MRDFQAPGRSLVYAANGMCATSHPLAAQVAVRMLQDGGNAVDAAIAAAVLLGLRRAGDVRDRRRLLRAAEAAGRGAAGRAERLGPRAGRARRRGAAGRGPRGRSPPRSAHAVTVPGAVDAFARLAADWGRLGLAASLAPAIRYAEEGVPVAPRVACDWARARRATCRATPGASSSATAAPLGAGPALPRPRPGRGAAADRPRRPRRPSTPARSPRTWSPRSARSAARTPSTTSPPPPAAYVEPIAGGYRGHELVELPPNGQGATAILLAKILARFDLAAPRPVRRGARPPRGRGGQARLRRPRPLRRRPRRRAAPARAHALRRHRRRARRADRPRPGAADPAAAAEAVHRETVYLCVVDRDRMAVSLIYSIYHDFGSGLASARFGINFQNRGAGFTLQPGPPERGRRRQAADAHHHPGDAPPRRPAR